MDFYVSVLIEDFPAFLYNNSRHRRISGAAGEEDTGWIIIWEKRYRNWGLA